MGRGVSKEINKQKYIKKYIKKVKYNNIKKIVYFYLRKPAVPPLFIYCLVYIAFFLVKRGSTSILVQ